MSIRHQFTLLFAPPTCLNSCRQVYFACRETSAWFIWLGFCEHAAPFLQQQLHRTYVRQQLFLWKDLIRKQPRLIEDRKLLFDFGKCCNCFYLSFATVAYWNYYYFGVIRKKKKRKKTGFFFSSHFDLSTKDSMISKSKILISKVCRRYLGIQIYNQLDKGTTINKCHPHK